MGTVVTEKAQVLHAIPGRIRVHMPGWSGQEMQHLEAQLRHVAGVKRVQANPLTENMLIQFDSHLTSEPAILEMLQTLEPPGDTASTKQLASTHKPFRPSVKKERQGKTIRIHIPVRGLDRDPSLAKRLIEQLEPRPGVHVTANALTGRILVEYTEHEVELEDIIADIVGVDLPDVPDETQPSDPLDPGPLMRSAIHSIGAALGLGLLATRRFLNVQEALPGASVAAQVASILGILQSIPPIRYGARKLLGRTGSDLLFSIPGMITQTLSSNALALGVNESDSLLLSTETYEQRTAWRKYEERIARAPSAQPDATIQLEAGERTPLAASVIEGRGTAIGRDALPMPVYPGGTIPPGALLFGGPFTLHLRRDTSFEAFTPAPRPAPVAPTLFERYLQVVSPLSLIYAAATALLTRSWIRTLAALLLVNPRPAMIGLDSSEHRAAARVLRAGNVIVGTRPDRKIHRPDCVFLDGARLLSDRLELASTLSLDESHDPAQVLAMAQEIAAAAGFPWGGVFGSTKILALPSVTFDGTKATATIEGTQYTLGYVEDWAVLPEAAPLRQNGNTVLMLRSQRKSRPLGIFALRPALAPGVSDLVETCQRNRVELGVLVEHDQMAVQALATRAHVSLIDRDNAVEAIRMKQQAGARVAFVADNAGAAAAFDACDLAIGVSNEHTRLPARVDLLAPDIKAVAAIVEAGTRCEETVRDAVAWSGVANIIGAVIGFRGMAGGLEPASRVTSIAALGAILDGWLRLRGGERPRSTISHLIDPHPERWGQREPEAVLQALQTSEGGLSSVEAAARHHKEMPQGRRFEFLSTILDQVRSPLIAVYAAGAGLSLLLGAPGDFVIISATIVANVSIGAWQEHKANRVAEALEQMGSSTALVLRDSQPVNVPAKEVVPGDVLLLTPGAHVAADARVLSAQGLEVDEAALTGESLPVAKVAVGGMDISRIVLEGSNVTTGTGRAVVAAVGHQTRMGATAAALAVEETEQSPLGVRLNRMLKTLLPLSLAGGVIVIASGLLLKRPLAAQLATGVTIVLAAIPEGLPLLASVSEAAVARRLASRNAVVRRLSAVEALGRVDVACTDKTGTLTQGRLALNLVADNEHEAAISNTLSDDARHVLLTAALACPHPDAPDVASHPTDLAVIRGAQQAGLAEQLYVKREAELAFDPLRSFYATLALGRLCIKGAPEALIPRCHEIRRHGERQPLDEAGRQELLTHSQRLAERGLRVLMVAEGAPDMSLDDPQELTALGFLGISDPLRPTVQAAVQRCRDAGVRVIMITGDHPLTARTIAREAGLLGSGDGVLNAAEMATLSDDELGTRLEHITVIARATPLDKLRIIERLRQYGHTVAMTGDGVNDAPALRLADVGVAMGRGGTEVARQTADVVLVDDDFSTLVETLVEGRSFWRNIRRALGLLLGGNLGELGLVVGASLLALNFPLNARQILAMNVITDVLPATAVALQEPEHRDLAGLEREGTAALGKPLHDDIFRRALASALPALVSYIIMLGSSIAEARSVAFASIVVTQLAQTLDAGRTEETLTRTVFGAVAISAGVLLATFTVPPLRNFLRLVMPGPLGWSLIGGGAIAAVILHSLLTFLPVMRLPHLRLMQAQLANTI